MAAITPAGSPFVPEFHGRRSKLGYFLGGHQRGGGYLLFLFVLTLLSIALAGTGLVWHFEIQRDKERELLFVGEEYRRAISRYYAFSPGQKQYPQKLEELLHDKRFPHVVRHLRKLYRDPMAPQGEWTLILQQGRITGVASSSPSAPIRKTGFDGQQSDFAEAATYAQWRFVSDGTVPGVSTKEGSEKVDR